MTTGLVKSVYQNISNEELKNNLDKINRTIENHYDLIEKVALFAGLYIASMSIPPLTGLTIAATVIALRSASRFTPLNDYTENLPSISNSDKGFLLIAGLAARILSAQPLPFGVCLAAAFSFTLFDKAVEHMRR